MYIRKTYINEVFTDDYTDKARDDVFVPVTQPSVTYKIWNAVLDIKTCFICADNHGRIFAFNDTVLLKPPVHIGCRCTLEEMGAIEADINYTQGRRNLHRILCSNDGLIFVTYDHYHTFYEIV